MPPNPTRIDHLIVGQMKEQANVSHGLALPSPDQFFYSKIDVIFTVQAGSVSHFVEGCITLLQIFKDSCWQSKSSTCGIRSVMPQVASVLHRMESLNGFLHINIHTALKKHYLAISVTEARRTEGISIACHRQQAKDSFADYKGSSLRR